MNDPYKIMSYILKRRSVRHYLERPVEKEKIELLLRAAMAGPTAANNQPWEFIVVTEPAILAKLRGKLMFARYNAPVGIIVCGNPKIANNLAAKRYWVQDCSAAMENILIAAAGMDLGAVWIGIHPLPQLVEAVSKILTIPEYVTPLGMAYVGYPGDVPPPHDYYDARRVYWQQYAPRKRRAKKKDAKHNVT